MPKELKSRRGDKPKPQWEQGTVFASTSGMDLTKMTAAERLNAQKDDLGRSVHSVKGAETAEYNRLKKRIEQDKATTREETRMFQLGERLGKQ